MPSYKFNFDILSFNSVIGCGYDAFKTNYSVLHSQNLHDF